MVCAVNADGGKYLELIAKGKDIINYSSDALWSDFILALNKKSVLVEGTPCACPNWVDPSVKSSLKTKEAHHFNRIFSFYLSSIFQRDSYQVDSFFLFSHHLKKYIDKFLSPGSLALDVGCGSGYYAKYMASRNAKVYALDIASNMSKHFVDEGSQVLFTRGDATDMPFDSDKFDFVLCPFILEHVADVETAVREMFRVLKKEGHLLMAIPVIPVKMLLPRLNKRLYLDFIHLRAFSSLPFSFSWKMSVFELLRFVKRSNGIIVKYESIFASPSKDGEYNNNFKGAIMKHLWPVKYFGEQAIVLCKKT